MKTATSLTGYKHTEEAICKMLKRFLFLEKSNPAIYGKTHKHTVRKLISKPGILNPMFGKQDSEVTL